MKKYFYVKSVRMKQKAVTIEPFDDEIRLFSSIEAVETWLMNNGLVYGQRKFFNYPMGDK